MFMLGNGHLSFPVVATRRFCYISMPGHWKIFRDAYRRGRNAAPIAGWNWFAIVTEHTEELKRLRKEW